jgi:hypothetical protein
MFGRSSSATAVADDTDVERTDPDGTALDDGETTVRRRALKTDEITTYPDGPVDRTERIPTGVGRHNRTDEDVVVPPATERPVEEPVAERPVVDEPVEERRRWAHVSMLATLSMIIGVLSVAATLTGLLAPLGFAGGIVAALLGIFAVPSVSRRHVSGHGLMMFGVLLGVVAVVLSLLAINGELSWLNSNTDEVATVHTWLNDHMHWLRRW